MPSDPLILAFDTSAAHCAAALLSGDRILVSRREDMGRGQAERLFPLLQEVLNEAGVSWQALDALGVGTGPGNFTGIRISVAAARGLALSLGIPAVGVSALEAAGFGHEGPRLAALDARRDRVYLQRLSPDGAPELAALDSLSQRADLGGLACVGPAAGPVAARTGGQVLDMRASVAEAIAHIAAARWREAPAAPAPLYLRAADAAPPRDAPPVILP